MVWSAGFLDILNAVPITQFRRKRHGIQARENLLAVRSEARIERKRTRNLSPCPIKEERGVSGSIQPRLPATQHLKKAQGTFAMGRAFFQ